jgi:transposase
MKNHKERRLTMKKTQATRGRDSRTGLAMLYTAFELSDTKWKLAFSDGSKMRHVAVAARDLEQLQREIGKAKKRFRLSGKVPIVSCYEAGRDGFWLHRYLISCGIRNVIVDSSSIEVNRRKRRAKSDRIDAGKLLRMLMRYHGGESRLWSVVRVPTEEQEDARHLHRELGVLKKERVMHRSRIRGLFIQLGIRIGNPGNRLFLTFLMRTWDGKELPSGLRARVEREYHRLRLVEEQITALKKQQEELIKEADTASLKKIASLRRLYGIGTTSAWVFVKEFFDWRKFDNRRQVAAAAGLTPTPYDSGSSRHEQGISKTGNRRIRAMAVEIAWCWLRFQSRSKLSRWFNKRFAKGGSRMRRIGIVAMARRLLIDLWRYLEHGVIPEGARFKVAG